MQRQPGSASAYGETCSTRRNSFAAENFRVLGVSQMALLEKDMLAASPQLCNGLFNLKCKIENMTAFSFCDYKKIFASIISGGGSHASRLS